MSLSADCESFSASWLDDKILFWVCREGRAKDFHYVNTTLSELKLKKIKIKLLVVKRLGLICLSVTTSDKNNRP